jgi:large subunit ribosomal protein L29
MDIDKVRALTDGELGNELATQRRHLYDLRFQLATRQLTDHSQLTQTRRTIARLLTVITERGLDENRVALSATPEAPKPAGRIRGRGRGSSGSSNTKKAAAPKTATGGKKE